MDARWSDFFNLDGGCMIDGVASSCGLAMSAVNSGAAVIGPENTTRWNSKLNNGQGGYQFFHAWADGSQGWSPFNWVPGISGSAASPSGPPSRKDMSPEEAARRRAHVAEFGRNGSGDEGVELTSSSDPQNPGVQFLRDNSGNTSYGPGKEKMIFDAILALYTDDCINAFKAAGLKDPFTLVTGVGGGVVIGPSSLAMNPDNTGYMGVPEQARRELLSEFGNTSSRAFTVMGQFTSDGRPRMFLNSSAFANGLGGLVSDMAHEFIHGAKVKGVTPPWYAKWQDDLSFDSKYQKIINTCRNAAQSFIDTRR